MLTVIAHFLQQKNKEVQVTMAKSNQKLTELQHIQGELERLLQQDQDRAGQLFHELAHDKKEYREKVHATLDNIKTFQDMRDSVQKKLSELPAILTKDLELPEVPSADLLSTAEAFDDPDDAFLPGKGSVKGKGKGKSSKDGKSSFVTPSKEDKAMSKVKHFDDQCPTSGGFKGPSVEFVLARKIAFWNISPGCTSWRLEMRSPSL
jgi:ElaB/YqjD/DUF883 family membrane-anchored ribosome-binding protein